MTMDRRWTKIGAMDLLVWMQHPYSVTLVRWLLGSIFLVAATSK